MEVIVLIAAARRSRWGAAAEVRGGRRWCHWRMLSIDSERPVQGRGMTNATLVLSAANKRSDAQRSAVIVVGAAIVE
jgi:hypothetical protein